MSNFIRIAQDVVVEYEDRRTRTGMTKTKTNKLSLFSIKLETMNRRTVASPCLTLRELATSVSKRILKVQPVN